MLCGILPDEFWEDFILFTAEIKNSNNTALPPTGSHRPVEQAAPDEVSVKGRLALFISSQPTYTTAEQSYTPMCDTGLKDQFPLVHQF